MSLFFQAKYTILNIMSVMHSKFCFEHYDANEHEKHRYNNKNVNKIKNFNIYTKCF